MTDSEIYKAIDLSPALDRYKLMSKMIKENPGKVETIFSAIDFHIAQDIMSGDEKQLSTAIIQNKILEKYKKAQDLKKRLESEKIITFSKRRMGHLLWLKDDLFLVYNFHEKKGLLEKKTYNKENLIDFMIGLFSTYTSQPNSLKRSKAILSNISKKKEINLTNKA